MPEASALFHILAVGWEHPGWEAGFYPDDLPAAWRLTYYANEFPGVLVPQRHWLQAGLQVLGGWAAEVGTNFRFYLEVDTPSDTHDYPQMARQFGDNFGGVVLDGPVAPHFCKQPGMPCCRCHVLDADALDSPGWRFDSLPVAVRISGDQFPDAMTQRRLLERLSSQTPPGAEILLFLDGDPPSVEKLRNMRLLAQLMGFA